MPKIDPLKIPNDGVFTAVFRKRKARGRKKPTRALLCVKHSYGQLHYSLPGGGLETEDGSVQARGRDEVREETGVLPRLIRILGVFNLQRQPKAIPEVVILFQGKHAEGKLGKGVDPNEISWCGYLTLEQIRAIGIGPGKFSPYQMAMAEFAFERLRNGHYEAVMGDLTVEGVKPFSSR